MSDKKMRKTNSYDELNDTSNVDITNVETTNVKIKNVETTNVKTTNEKTTNINTNIMHTNNIIYDVDNKGKRTYYLPAYLRLKVKNFTSISLQKLEAQANATIILTVFYDNLDKKIVQTIKQGIVLQFNRDNAIKLTDGENLETKVKIFDKKKEIMFITRRLFNLSIESNIFWTPFQIIYLFLSVTVDSVTVGDETFKFNLMDMTDLKDKQKNLAKLSSTQNCNFGHYNLAQQLARAVYTNQRDYYLDDIHVTDQQRFQNYKQRRADEKQEARIEAQKEAQKAKRKAEAQGKAFQLNKKEEETKIQGFEKAHFCVPLYKYPLVSLATIFIPLWLLAIINLAIFFQENQLNNRIACIASVMIASVALMPTIRSQIPPNPTIVFVQILVFLQTGTSLLTLIHSVTIIDIPDYVIIWYKSGLYMVSVGITLITVIIVGVLILLHYLYWRPGYSMKVNGQKQFKFNRSQWSNILCDCYFDLMKIEHKHNLNYKNPDKVEPTERIKEFQNFSLIK